MAKTVFALIFILIVSASISSNVFAAIKSRSNPIPVTLGGFSLTPTIGGYFFAGSEQRDATQSYGLKAGYDILGKSIADSLGIEGSLNYFTTKSKSDASDATGYLFRLDAIYPTIIGGKWMPFLAVGAGGIVIDSVSHADKSPLLNYGAGLKYFLEDYLAVRVDARHLIVYNNVNTRNNFEVGIGMSYYFGKERKKKPVPPPATKQKEKEDAKNGKKTNGTATKSASGIPTLEEIAMTAGGKADEEKPAVKGKTPAGPPSPPLLLSLALSPLLALESAAKPLFQAEAPKERAGVVQSEAKAGAPTLAPVPAPVPAKVETPAKVEAPPVAPTPVPATPPAKIGVVPVPVKPEEPERQAVEEKIVRKLWINFDVNSSYVKPKYSKKLKEIADILNSSADTSARIEGHTDSTGKLSFNIKLSEKRAQSVRNSLMKFGVDSGRISSVFYGPSRPIAENTTIKGKQKNRRVEILVTLIEREPKVRAAVGKSAVKPETPAVAPPAVPMEAPAKAVSTSDQVKPETVALPERSKSGETEIKAPAPATTPAGVEAPPAPAKPGADKQVEPVAVEPRPVTPTPGKIPEPEEPPVTLPLAPSLPAEAAAEPCGYYTLSTGGAINRKELEPLLDKLKAAGKQPVVVRETRDTDIYSLVSECGNTRESAMERQTQISRWVKDAFIIREGESYCVAAGSFQVENNALQELKRLAHDGIPVKVVKSRKALPVWRIKSGCYADTRQAEEATKTDVAQGIETTIEKVSPGMAVPEEQKVVRELTIEFDFDRYDIQPIYVARLNEIADFLKSSPASSALIEGHSDNIGKKSYNLKLSNRRAQSIKTSLVKLGIASNRIFIKGYGPTIPVADNATAEGRRNNRRVVTIVINIY